jgi:hypothetical protein
MQEYAPLLTFLGTVITALISVYAALSLRKFDSDIKRRENGDTARENVAIREIDVAETWRKELLNELRACQTENRQLDEALRLERDAKNSEMMVNIGLKATNDRLREQIAWYQLELDKYGGVKDE